VTVHAAASGHDAATPDLFNQVPAAVLAGAAQKVHSRPNLASRQAARMMEQIVTFSLSFRRAGALSLAVAGIMLSSAFAQTPSPRVSPSGNYLAARHANAQRDASAASAYYRAALKADPGNGELLDRAFISMIVEGDIEEAVKLADRVLQKDKNDKIARLVVGVRALKQKQYTLARQNITQSVRGPVTDLTAALLNAWAQLGTNDSKAAVEGIDRLAGAEWYALFKETHAGMILDLAGNKKDAAKRLEHSYKLDPSSLRIVEAYGSFVSRSGAKDEALKVFQTFDKTLPQHPLIVSAMETVKRGDKLPPLVVDPQTGAAEVLYGLGASLGRRGGEDLGLVYLQLALYLAPQHPLALLSLADLYEAMKKPQLAIKIYEQVPAKSPLKRNADIQLAINLDSIDKTDEAKQRLNKLIAEHPKDTEAILALGNIMRGRKQFAECADVYSKAIEAVPNPEKGHWVMHYFRGICHERSKRWSLAEIDLKKALELYPDQPHVLNYLGYSWIDLGVNLDDGMRMIRRAVEQRPDDGYIVDSLGWAHFRLGDFENATKQLEKAVELKPDDPTINDHLGDAYWKIGRVLEAQFQWSHARDLKPEPEELAKIEQKLRSGLPEETSSSADAAKKKSGSGG
jgi:tetratricopeptide (TPR) repeat protein